LPKDFVKVVLTGDAGDENFGGYPRYLRSQWVACFTKIPEKLRRDILPNLLRAFSTLHWRGKTLNRLADFVESLSQDQARNYAEQIKIFNAKEKKNIYTEEFSKYVEGIDPMDFLINKFESRTQKTC
jgi:asparagine synthase (glutamine-hydrolysing)